MAPLSAPRALLGLWCLSVQTSYGLFVPTPKGDVFAASDTTRQRRVPPPLPATTPVTPTEPAVIPPANGVKVGDSGGDGLDGGAPRAARPSSTDFGKFVKRRQAELGRVVVDLRPSSDFRREHFVGATSIPADELEARLLELPPPFAQPLSIVGNEEVRACSILRSIYFMTPVLYFEVSTKYTSVSTVRNVYWYLVRTTVLKERYL